MACLIIAEAGICHDGSVDKARKLIDAARAADADIVKFQFFSSQILWKDDRIKHLELRFDDFVKLHAHCQDVGIEFACTPFGVNELLLLQPLLKRVKIASGCITRQPLMRAAVECGLPLILSTGMSTPKEIDYALREAYMPDAKVSHITLLHCTSAYPCPISEVNLNAMQNLAMVHGCDEVGYSDHTLGITIPIAAAAMGATVIEKHLTLDRTAEGPDHKASIEPNDFRVMVSAIRTVEEALGDGVKRVMKSEEKLREAWRVPAKADRAT